MLAIAAPMITATDADTAWALAYSGFVIRFCDSWEQRLEALPPKFLPSPENFNTLWAEGSVRQRAFRAGGLAAEAAYKSDVAFCKHPLRSHPMRSGVIERLLMPADDGHRL